MNATSRPGAALLAARLLPALLLAAAVLHMPALSAAPPEPAQSSSAAQRYLGREEVAQFIDAMVERHGFARGELERLFAQAVFQPSVIKAISPPADPSVRSWRNYRALMVDTVRIKAGRRFRAQHAAALARAEAQFGVPARIIVAIIGVETVYGRNMGRYRLIDALATLAFDYPPRAEYFRMELENFLLLARDGGMDPFNVKGSYAGAFGIPQFMPGSHQRYAVDFDGNGRTDLAGSPEDAIGSVANFLKEHGWQDGVPAALPARVASEDVRQLVDGGVKPVHAFSALADYGIVPLRAAQGLAPDTLFALVELETPGQASEYRIALQNFYAITRYNRSSFYAAAVLELADALRARISGP